MSKVDTPQNSVIGASGEYLVLSQLLKQNFIAGKAPENTKDYDLIVLNKDGTSSSPIQVKTTGTKTGWVLMKKHELPIKNLYFSFVYMGANLVDTEIFILDAEKVATAVKFSHAIWLKLPGTKGQKHNDTDMRRLCRDYKSIFSKVKNYEEYLSNKEIEFLKDHSEGWLLPYKDSWESLLS